MSLKAKKNKLPLVLILLPVLLAPVLAQAEEYETGRIAGKHAEEQRAAIAKRAAKKKQEAEAKKQAEAQKPTETPKEPEAPKENPPVQ